MRKLGGSIDKARPFYIAKGEADDLQKKCLEAAVQFQRANGKYIFLLFFHPFNITEKKNVDDVRALSLEE
jgi:hypothetical protein